MMPTPKKQKHLNPQITDFFDIVTLTQINGPDKDKNPLLIPMDFYTEPVYDPLFGMLPLFPELQDIMVN